MDNDGFAKDHFTPLSHTSQGGGGGWIGWTRCYPEHQTISLTLWLQRRDADIVAKVPHPRHGTNGSVCLVKMTPKTSWTIQFHCLTSSIIKPLIAVAKSFLKAVKGTVLFRTVGRHLLAHGPWILIFWKSIQAVNICVRGNLWSHSRNTTGSWNTWLLKQREEQKTIIFLLLL